MKIKACKSVIEYICRQAKYGYETPYKQERFGFLFGKESRSGIWRVTDCHLYKGGFRKRTGIYIVVENGFDRAMELSRMKKLAWIGTYHSHVEVKGEIFYGLSEDDRKAKPFPPVELLAVVWPNDTNGKRGHLRKRIKVRDQDYQYLFTGYVREKGKLVMAKLEQMDK